jgi:hypothetical protein
VNEKINSSDALVAYLDILGYSDLVKGGEYANICYGAINSALYRWDQYLELHKYNIGEAVKRHITLQVMSDTFVVTLNQQAILLEEDADNSALRWNILMIFLAIISFLVQDCMRQIKRLFRGAIVKGKHYQQGYENLKGSTFIFSEALCEAHGLERDIANVPRILIDKSILNTLQKSEIDLLCKENRPDRELIRDSDGFFYLNIYASVVNNTALISILRETASIVRSNLGKQCLPAIVGKYIWFANYHNAFIRHVIKSNASASIPCFNEIKDKEQEVLIKIPDL